MHVDVRVSCERCWCFGLAGVRVWCVCAIVGYREIECGRCGRLACVLALTRGLTLSTSPHPPTLSQNRRSPGHLEVSIEADLEDELFLAELDRIEQVIRQRAFAIFSSIWIQNRPGCKSAWVQKVCVRAPTHACDECTSQKWQASL